MGLFSPWFLGGLAVLGLPLWLHLLRQFKRTPQPFSSLMFFERRIQSSSKHRRLRYLILLALRMALLALLALLFANPFVNRASQAMKARKLTVMAIDRSFSMRYRNRIEEAKKQAEQLVSTYSGRQPFQVVALDSHVATLTQPETDRSAVTSAIAAVEPTDDTSSYGEFSRSIRVMEQTTGLNLDVHLFTDAQQTAMPAAFSDLQVGPHTSLSIHIAGTQNAPNWAVESVSVPARIYDAANVRLIAGITGWLTDKATRKVSVAIDGKVVASKDLTVPGCGRSEIEFDNLVIPYGSHRGEVRIEPHDDLPNDDTFLFSIDHSDPRKVLFLSSTGRPTDSFFYKSAVDASSSIGLRVQPDSFGNAAELDLSAYAFVVLNNPGILSEQLTRNLSNYVMRGGAVFIGVGPATAQSGAIPLTENHIAETAIVQGAGEQQEEMFTPETFLNVQFVATPHIAAQAGDRIISRLADGYPLLLEEAKGEGKVLIFDATLDNSTSDFPVHASFVPFVAATGSYLSGQGNESSSVVVGSAVPLRQSKAQNATVDVIAPDGKHEIPISDATRIMNYNPGREGFYDVHPASGRRVLLAVHADRRESNLTKVPDETLILWRNTGTSSSGPAETGSAATVPFSLWRYVLALVLMAAVMESIFATRYLSEESQAT